MLFEKWGRFERFIAVWSLALGTMSLFYIALALSKLLFSDLNVVASWVQAFGSIAAIWAGFRLAKEQYFRRQEESRRIEAEAQRKASISSFLLFRTIFDTCGKNSKAIISILKKYDDVRPAELSLVASTVRGCLAPLEQNAINQLALPAASTVAELVRVALVGVLFNVEKASQKSRLKFIRKVEGGYVFLALDSGCPGMSLENKEETIKSVQYALDLLKIGVRWADDQIKLAGGIEELEEYEKQTKDMMLVISNKFN